MEALKHNHLDTIARQLEHLSIRSKHHDKINSFSNMFDTLSISGSKRTREVEEDEPADYRNHMIERRTARARDNSATYDFTANNSLNSTSLFVPVSSSTSRARSNALSIPQANLTPYPSDTEEVQNGSGFAKIPTLSLRSCTTGVTLNPFSAAQSPAESFESSQHEIEDSQDTSVITEDSQNDFTMDMDMDMDDAPVVSPGASFSQSNNFGSSHTQSNNHWQTFGRLPSPAVSEELARAHSSSSLDIDNFGQMGMQLHGARQDAQGQWNPRASSFGGSKNLGHVATGMVPPPQKKKGGRLVMGYRADCKKCRDKVPGHYNHFL